MDNEPVMPEQDIIKMLWTEDGRKKLEASANEYIKQQLRATAFMRDIQPKAEPKPWYKRIRTWMWEAAVVATVLAIVAKVTGGKRIEGIGSLAVLFTFMHAQVGFRFSEAAEESRDYSDKVECHRWMTRYFLIKELLWCTYFTALGAWSGLVGVAVFLLYPLWRKFHLRNRRITCG